MKHLSNTKTAAALTESIRKDEASMQPILRRLRQYEGQAIKQKLIDPVMIQPKVIRGWPDLMERAEHLYYMLGGNSRILSDSATRVRLSTFLQTDKASWEGEVERFLNDNSFIGLTGTKTSQTATSHRSSDNSEQKGRKVNGDSNNQMHTPSFVMLRIADSDDGDTGTGKVASHAEVVANAVPTTYSKVEDSRSIRDAAKLEAAIKDKPTEDAELESVLEKANLRSIDSLVDEEARQDENAVENISRDILSNQGVMQPEIATEPGKDEVLSALIQSANASSGAGETADV